MKSFIRRMVVGFVAGFVLAGMTLLGTSALAQQKPGKLGQQLLGTWLLVSQYVEVDGKKIERFGSNPKGIYILERNGRFALIIQRPGIPKFASNNAMTGTAEENKAVVQGSIASFGTYKVDEKESIINSHVDGATYPNWDGEDQKRVIKLSSDELRISLPGQPSAERLIPSGSGLSKGRTGCHRGAIAVRCYSFWKRVFPKEA